jgi:hypothetical protein
MEPPAMEHRWGVRRFIDLPVQVMGHPGVEAPELIPGLASSPRHSTFGHAD